MNKRLFMTVGLIFALTVHDQLPLLAQADPVWIGKRVVPKTATSHLLVNGEAVERGGDEIDIYRVEQTDGTSLLLKAETHGLSGWAKDRSGHPCRASRRLLHASKSRPTRETLSSTPHGRCSGVTGRDYDKALRDYDEAIRLDPQNASSHRGRGLVWHSKNEYDKAIADFDEADPARPKSALAFIGRGTSLGKQEGIQQGHRRLQRSHLARSPGDRRLRHPRTRLACEERIRQGDHRLQHGHPTRFTSTTCAYCNRGNAWAALQQIRQGPRRFRSRDPERRKLCPCPRESSLALVNLPEPKIPRRQEGRRVGDESV